ncbi:MAG: hypothetical protein HZA93_27810 [Verrucomicrobia bacterium]|nr:hypothetical protein [Verrucomicrobiota bacterium]
MDEELAQLEAELKRLRPAAPSRELLARLERELACSENAGSVSAAVVRRRSRAWWLAAAALPIAAAITLLVTFRARHELPVTPPVTATLTVSEPALFKPVAAENVLYSARDEGLVTLDDGTPARRERLRYVDTITWKNPQTNASVRWTVPREEVRVVPVRFQ